MSALGPATPDHLVSDAGIVVQRLRDVYASRRTRPLDWRLAQLDGLARFLTERRDLIVAALQEDLQRPAFEAQATDIGGVLAEIRLLSRRLGKLMRPRRVPTPLRAQPSTAVMLPEPWGVVLILPAWNFPIALSLIPLAGALAGGNTAIVKPSELAPASSQLLARELGRYVDPDAVRVIEGGPDVAEVLLRERFDHIHYTGSSRVGRIVMRAASAHLTPVTLELGGKNPAYVHADTDLAVAARRIFWGRLLNAGQTCLSPDWVLADRRIEARLINEMIRWARRAYGPDPRRSPDLARMVDERHFRRVVELLDDAGEIVFGGDHDERERYIAPTIIRDVPPDHPILHEEIFGPVLPVVAVADAGEAIKLMSSRPQPLTMYLFTHDDQVVERITAETSAGSVVVNQVFTQGFNSAVPVGGVGESGMGTYTGIHSFECFTHLKPVLKSPIKPDLPVLYPPYRPWKERVLRRLLG